MDLPNYNALRLGADLASSIRGQTVWFDYGGDGLEITPPATEASPLPTAPPVPVSTPLSASERPMVTGATVSVQGYRPTSVSADTCSALFWSESAVEKFLLPYYVSAAGPAAYLALHGINRAWYNFRVEAPVCALAFGYPSQTFDRSVRQWDTLSVIVCEPDPQPDRRYPLGKLVAHPILDYLGTMGPPPPTELPPPAPFSWGDAMTANETPTPIDSVGAREVAEYVSGLRGQVVSVYAADGDGGLQATLGEQDGPPLFTASCGFVRPERPTATVTLDVTLPDGTVETKPLAGIGDGPTNVADSVFWTDGAVEMLMLPYYTSVQGRGAPWYLAAILGKWSGAIPTDLLDALRLAAESAELLGRTLVELPVEVVEGLVDRLEGKTPVPRETETGPFETSVYALAHLPNSEWVDREDVLLDLFTRDAEGRESSIYLENRTWLLTSAGDVPLVAPGRRLVPLSFRG